MSRRFPLPAPLLALALSGCVDRGGWQPTPQVAPQKLELGRTVADAHLEPSAWPADGWWRRYGDPQLDALIDEALAGSPSLATAQARLRAAQAQAVTARAARLPATTVSAQADRQRYPEDYLFPPPFAGGYVNNGRVALDFGWDLDFWGRNRALLAAARSGVAAAEADRAAARLALAVAVVQAYVQLDLQYALLDVTNDNLKQQQSILELTQQRVSAGLENSARVKQSEGQVALTRVGVAYVEAGVELARNQLADLAGAGPDRGAQLRRPQLARAAATSGRRPSKSAGNTDGSAIAAGGASCGRRSRAPRSGPPPARSASDCAPARCRLRRTLPRRE